MQPIRTLIADDEPEARHGLAELLRVDPDIAVVGECDGGGDVIAAVARTAPDLVFLDVEMPGLDGFGVVRAVQAGPAAVPCLIFVTAYERYALRAFEVHAADYLLKPFSDARFRDALAAGKTQVWQRRAGAIGRQLAALYDTRPADGEGVPSGTGREVPSAPLVSTTPTSNAAGAGPGAYLRHIAVRSAGTVSLVRVADVDWISADDYYARLHVAGRTHLIREPVQELATRLDPKQFVRIHRSTIVNLDRVRRIRAHPEGGHEVVLHDGTQLRLSRSRRATLEAALGQPL